VREAAPLAGLAALSIVVASACGSQTFVEPLRTGPPFLARFASTEEPSSRGPGLGPSNLYFASPRIGFVATTGGGAELRGIGWQQPTEPGRIERTTNGGAEWETVWSGRAVVFSSISFVERRDAVASGNDVHGFSRDRGGVPPTRPVILATHNGGKTWRRARPPFRYVLADVQPVAARSWVAIAQWESGAIRLRRTDDAGATWRVVRTPPRTRAVRFVTPSLGFAGARGVSCPHRSQLWRTEDGGATWLALAGTCGPDYVDIDPVTTDLVVTAQTYGYDLPGNVIRRSRDGGATWQMLHRDGRHGWKSLERVDFSDANHGWAVSHESGQGFCTDAVHVTRDGGRTWRSRTFPIRPSAFVGSSAWAGEENDGVVWRTNDYGATWHPSVRPGHVWPRLRYATPSQVVLDTNIGTFRVGGHFAIRSRRSVDDREAARRLGRVAYMALDRDLDGVPMITSNRGRAWKRLRSPLPTGFVGDVAFADSRHGLVAGGDALDGGALPVYATDDGGRTWKRLRVPRGAQRGAAAVLAPGIVFLPSGLDPPGYSVAYLSADEGRHWRSIRLVGGTAWSCSAAARGASPWIVCNGEEAPQRTILLVSPDGGRHWSELRTKRHLDSFAPVTAREAWATSGAGLWHTTDSARTWRRVWLRVPTDLRSFVQVPAGYRC
jgi:photosystem II stability/assembly factor-like uncharacterized protein